MVAIAARTANGTGRRAPTLVAPYGRPEWSWRWSRQTYVMGILNVTPDSFSGDGLARDVAGAIARGHQLVADGADVVDVGGESSEARDHQPIPVRDEIERVLPVIAALTQAHPEVLISVDTWKAEVAATALSAGAHLVNDVGAMRRDPEMRYVAAEYGAPIVVMHSQEGTQYRDDDPMAELRRFFDGAIDDAVRAGIRPEQLILDAGFGFGKTVHQDLECTRRLRELTVFGRPILHAPSRKRTIGRVLGCPTTVPERLLGTAATVTVGIANGADIVRVHDVLDMKRCAVMSDALLRGYDRPDE